jgi:hypothetical protein
LKSRTAPEAWKKSAVEAHDRPVRRRGEVVTGRLGMLHVHSFVFLFYRVTSFTIPKRIITSTKTLSSPPRSCWGLQALEVRRVVVALAHPKKLRTRP